MNLLHVGDIVGSPGRRAFAQVVGRLRGEGAVDFVIVNGENAAAGKGITPSIAEDLFRAGADVVTLGDHVWDQKEILGYLGTEPRIIRPLNYAPGCPGRGWTTVESPFGKITVIILIGRVFLPPADCPFRAVDALLSRGADQGRIVCVEVHAEATSEKKAMGHFLDGRVTSVVGTHTHVQTSDERLLPKGTAYLTDLGMTGPALSVIGMENATVLPRFLTGMPTKFEVAGSETTLEGALIDIDESTGRARSIRRVREPLEP
jgi:hypothetical protein